MITLKKYGKMWLDDEGIQWIMVGDALEEFANLKNKMALKPNQEVIEWHECSEELPTDSGHYLVLCEDGDVYIDWFNNGSDEAGNPEDHCPWGDPEWLIEGQDPGAYKVIAWAYMPKGVTND
jgi:hypothetical protein